MTRLVSGVVMAAAALAAIVWLPLLGLRLLACVVAVLAAHEYGRIVGLATRAAPLVLAGAVAVVCWWTGGSARLDAAMLMLALLAWVAAEVLFEGLTVQQAAAAALGPIYIGLPLGMLAALHGLRGWQATLLLMATVVVSDSSQYYSGRAFGRRPLAPAISPKKTVEGALGGMLFGTVFMAAAGSRVLPDAGIAQLAAMGLLLVVLGICGDLFESRLKRVAGVKDSSSLIPGHGGVLDRIDALLFTIPPFYLFVSSLT